MPRVVHFEIHVDDPDRAGKFYREVFDWRFQKWEGPVEYWLITTGDSTEPGIDGGMMRRRDPQGNVYNTIAVNNIDASISSIEKHGGTIVVPKMPISGVGWLAYFKDTEGNIGGVMQTDHNAK